MGFLARPRFAADATPQPGSRGQPVVRARRLASDTAVSQVTRVWPYAEGLRVLPGPPCAVLPPAAERPASLLHGQGRSNSTAPGGAQLPARHAFQVDSTAAASIGAYTPLAALPVGRSRRSLVAGGGTRMPAPTMACAWQWGPPPHPRRLVTAHAAVEARHLDTAGATFPALSPDACSAKAMTDVVAEELLAPAKGAEQCGPDSLQPLAADASRATASDPLLDGAEGRVQRSYTVSQGRQAAQGQHDGADPDAPCALSQDELGAEGDIGSADDSSAAGGSASRSGTEGDRRRRSTNNADSLIYNERHSFVYGMEALRRCFSEPLEALRQSRTRQSVRVYGRLPGGELHPYDVTLQFVPANGFSARLSRVKRLAAGMELAHGATLRLSALPDGRVVVEPAEPRPADAASLNAVALTQAAVRDGSVSVPKYIMARLLGEDLAGRVAGPEGIPVQLEGWGGDAGVLRSYNRENSTRWQARRLSAWLRSNGAAPGDSLVFGVETRSFCAAAQGGEDAPAGVSGPATGPRTLTVRLVRAVGCQDAGRAGAPASATRQLLQGARSDAQCGKGQGDAPAAEGAVAGSSPAGVLRDTSDPRVLSAQLLHADGQPGTEGQFPPQLQGKRRLGEPADAASAETATPRPILGPNAVTLTANHIRTGHIAVPIRMAARLLGTEQAAGLAGGTSVALRPEGGDAGEGILRLYRLSEHTLQWRAMRITAWLRSVGAAPGDSVVFGVEASSASAAAEAQDAGDASTGMADPVTSPRTLTVRLVRAAAASAPRQLTGKASPKAQRRTSRGHADGHSGSVTAAKGGAGGRGHVQTGTPRQGGASEPLHGYGQPHSSHAPQSYGSPLSSLVTERLQAMLRSVGGLLKELGLRDGDTARMLAIPDGRVAVEFNGVVLAQSASTPPAPEPEGVTVTAAHLRSGKIAVPKRIIVALLGKEYAACEEGREGVPLKLEGGAGAEGVLRSYNPHNQWQAMRLAAWFRSVGASPGDTVLFGVDASCAPTAAEEALAGIASPGVSRHAAGPRVLTAKLLRADGQPDAGRRGPPRRKGKGRRLKPVKLAPVKPAEPRPVLETDAVTLTANHIRTGHIAVPIRTATRLLGKEQAAGLAGGGSLALRPEGGDAGKGVLRCYRLTEDSVQWQAMRLTAWLRSVGAAPGDSVVFGLEASLASAAAEAQDAGGAPTGVSDRATGPRTLTIRLVRAAAVSAPQQLTGKAGPDAQRGTSRGHADGDSGSASAPKDGASGRASGTGEGASAQDGRRARRKADASTLHARKGKQYTYYGAAALRHHFPEQLTALRQSGRRQSVRVYGRLPGGELHPYDLTLYAGPKTRGDVQPVLSNAGRLVADLGLARGEDVRLSALLDGRVVVGPAEPSPPTEPTALVLTEQC